MRSLRSCKNLKWPMPLKRTMRLLVHPTATIQGEAKIPGDKSITHRAIMLGAIANGTTVIRNYLAADDCQHTLSVLKQLGTDAKMTQDEIIIQGQGLYGLKPPNSALYFGNAGTGIRLVCGLLAGQPFDTELTGDPHLTKRPMKRIITPLQKMGANIQGNLLNDEHYPPIKIVGGQQLQGIHYDMPIASAQLKSCLLLAGLYATGPTRVSTPSVCRDHTERLLDYMGCRLQTQGHTVELSAGELTAKTIDVPSDISSAAFFMVGAAMTPGSSVVLRNIGINPTRMGIIKILNKMGAKITLDNRQEGFEPTADIVVEGHTLQGVTVPKDWVGEAIDEFPILFIAACAAKGTSVFQGLKELTVKESNRLEAMANGLKKLGANITLQEEGLLVEGGQPLQGGVVDSFADHRIAMSFAIASLLSKDPIEIKQTEYISTSFPNFVDLANKLGLVVSEKEN